MLSFKQEKVAAVVISRIKGNGEMVCFQYILHWSGV